MPDGKSAPAPSPTGARCAFCEHLNPAGAKFCNECAADLQLTLCERCSAVNRRGMASCHKCGGTLPSQEREPVLAASVTEDSPSHEREPLLAASVTEDPPSAPRRGSVAALVAVLALATIGVLYFADQAPGLPPFDLRSAATALRLDAEPIAPSDAPSADSVAPVPATAAPPAATLAPPAATEPQPAASGGADAPKPPIPVAQPEQAAPTPGADTRCTDAIIALGLCDRGRSNEPK